jgi:hypothetical protein
MCWSEFNLDYPVRVRLAGLRSGDNPDRNALFLKNYSNPEEWMVFFALTPFPTDPKAVKAIGVKLATFLLDDDVVEELFYLPKGMQANSTSPIGMAAVRTPKSVFAPVSADLRSLTVVIRNELSLPDLAISTSILWKISHHTLDACWLTIYPRFGMEEYATRLDDFWARQEENSGKRLRWTEEEAANLYREWK